MVDRRAIRHRGNQLDCGAARIIEQDVEGVRYLGQAGGELELASEARGIGRKFEVEGLDDPRDAVDEQVARDAARVFPIASPAETAVRIPRPLWGRSEPRFPVEIVAGPRVRVDRVSPE